MRRSGLTLWRQRRERKERSTKRERDSSYCCHHTYGVCCNPRVCTCSVVAIPSGILRKAKKGGGSSMCGNE